MTDFSTRPRPVRRSGDALLVLLGACVLAASGAAAVREWQWLERTRQAMDQTQRAISEVEARARTLEGEKVTDGEALLSAQFVLGASAPPVAALSALEQALPADVRLESLGLSYGAQLQLEMQVTARRATAYDEFLNRLATSPRFKDIVPGAETRDASLRAAVKAQYRPGAR